MLAVFFATFLSFCGNAYSDSTYNYRIPSLERGFFGGGKLSINIYAQEDSVVTLPEGEIVNLSAGEVYRITDDGFVSAGDTITSSNPLTINVAKWNYATSEEGHSMYSYTLLEDKSLGTEYYVPLAQKFE